MADNKDVFGVESTIGGAWNLDGAVLELEGSDELVITQADITYQRQSQKFSPLNQKRKYMTIGEADGAISLGMIVGPVASIKDFLKRYSDACNLRKNVMTLKPTGSDGDCGDQDEIAFTCTGVLINGITLGVAQQGASLTVVRAGLTCSFISLKIGP